jgi:hypothetical protein
MRRIIFALALAALAGWAAITLQAQSAPSQAEPAAVQPAELDTQIEKLLELPAEERRARLKQLTPGARRGLWLKLKRAEFERRGARPRASAKDLEPRPIEAPPGKGVFQKVVGSIAYDRGFPAVGFGSDGLIGNRFNTHTGVPVLNPGTIATVRAVVVPGSTGGGTTRGVTGVQSAGFVVFGQQTSMGGAPALFSTFAPASGVIDTVSFTGLSVAYTGSSFFVMFGDFTPSYIPVFGTETTMGQGHHAAFVPSTGTGRGTVTAISDLPGFNGLIRTTGNIVPVELMKFDVE